MWLSVGSEERLGFSFLSLARVTMRSRAVPLQEMLYEEAEEFIGYR